MDVSRVARPGVIVAAGWFALLVYAYPGRMTAESFALLRQARTKFFDPANPPALARWWRWLELLVAGPMAMLLVQTVAFALGAYTLLRRVVPEMRAACLTAALLVFPPITAQLATISSSAMMTGLLVVGVIALLGACRPAHVAGLVALFVATAVQPRALVATLPLLLLLFRWRADATGLRRFGAAAIAWGVISAAALGATMLYTKQPTPLWSFVEPGANAHWRAVPITELPPDALRLGVPAHTTVIQDSWTAALTAIADVTPLFWPWLFAGLAALTIPLALRRPDALALAISAVLFQLVFRDSLWPIAAACLAALIVACDRWWRR